MTFLSPNALWLLFALPLIYVFNMVKHRRMPVPVATLLIWKKVLERAEAPRSSRKNFFNFTLLLELLVFSAFVLALARPAGVSEAEGRRVLVILDTSASMKAITEDGRTRFQKALEVLGHVRYRLEKEDSLEIITTTPAGKSGSGEYIATDIASDSAKSVLGKIAGFDAARDTVIVITDDTTILDGVLPESVIAVGVGGALPNVGIVSAEARGSNGDAGLFDVFLKLARNGAIDWPRVGITLNTTEGRKFKFSGKVNENGEFYLPSCSFDNAGVVEIDCGSGGALESDNFVFLNMVYDSRMAFALHGDPGHALMRALAALEDTDVIAVSGDARPPADAVPVFIGRTPKPPYPKVFICVAPRSDIPGICSIFPAADVKSVILGGKIIDDVDIVDFPGNPGAIASLQSEVDAEMYFGAEFADGNRSIIAKLTAPDAVSYVIAFDPAKTPWPETAGYALFWAALAEKLSGETVGGTVSYVTYRTGQPLDGSGIPFAAGVDESLNPKRGYSLLSERETTTEGNLRPLPDSFLKNMKIETARIREYWAHIILLGILLFLAESVMIIFIAARRRGKRKG